MWISSFCSCGLGSRTPGCLVSSHERTLVSTGLYISLYHISLGWPSISQPFWCSPGYHGCDPWPFRKRWEPTFSFSAFVIAYPRPSAELSFSVNTLWNEVQGNTLALWCAITCNFDMELFGQWLRVESWHIPGIKHWAWFPLMYHSSDGLLSCACFVLVLHALLGCAAATDLLSSMPSYLYLEIYTSLYCSTK